MNRALIRRTKDEIRRPSLQGFCAEVAIALPSRQRRWNGKRKRERGLACAESTNIGSSRDGPGSFSGACRALRPRRGSQAARCDRKAGERPRAPELRLRQWAGRTDETPRLLESRGNPARKRTRNRGPQGPGRSRRHRLPRPRQAWCLDRRRFRAVPEPQRGRSSDQRKPGEAEAPSTPARVEARDNAKTASTSVPAAGPGSFPTLPARAWDVYGLGRLSSTLVYGARE